MNIDSSTNWKSYVLKDSDANWGELNSHSLKGAVILGVDSPRERSFIHQFIHFSQRISMWMGFNKKPTIPEIGTRELEIGNVIFEKKAISHAFIIQGRFTQEDAIKAAELRKTKKAALKALHYSWNPIRWTGVFCEKRQLAKEVDRLAHYKIKEGKENNYVWISEAGESGLRTKIWALGEDDYEHLIIFVPPPKTAKVISKFAQNGSVNELELLEGKKQYNEVPKFHFKQGWLIPFIGLGSSLPFLKSRKQHRIRHSASRAVVNLIEGTAIKTQCNKNKSMVCSEFATRILQSNILYNQLIRQYGSKKNIKQAIKENRTQVIEFLDKVSLDNALINRRPAGTMPYQLTELLMEKCQRKMEDIL